MRAYVGLGSSDGRRSTPRGPDTGVRVTVVFLQYSRRGRHYLCGIEEDAMQELTVKNEIEIAAPPARVWQVLTDPSLTRR